MIGAEVRADPGFRHCQKPRQRGRADLDHLPPSDALGDDARIGSRRLRPALHIWSLWDGRQAAC
jgi:hypothetical protein